MGFFSKLTDVWHDWHFDWNSVTDSVKSSGPAAWDGVKNTWAGTFNLVLAPFSDDYSVREAISKFTDVGGNVAGTVGGVGGALTEIPGIRQVLGSADWAQSEFVKRPLGTAALMMGDAYPDPGSLVSGEQWRKAYNTTTYVSPGQALFYAGMMSTPAGSIPQMFAGEKSEVERRDMLRRNPHFGLLMQDPRSFDPRNRQFQDQYHSNPYMQMLSGGMDAGITMFADPTVFLSKFGLVAKARYWSKEMNASAVNAGKHLDYQDGNAYAKLKDHIRQAKSPDAVQQTVFNNHYNGAVASNLLWSVAKDEYRYGGDADLFDLSYRAMYGDSEAWQTLADDAPRIADVLGSKFANYSIGQLGKQYGLGDEAVDAQWNALRESKVEAWIDATANGRGLFGQLGKSVESGGLLTGQSAPRVRMSSKWRAGVHQWARPAPVVTFGDWVKRGASYMRPTSKTGRQLDLQDINGSKLLRMNLEHSRLDNDEVAYWTSSYGRATSPEARFAIYNHAENAAFAKHAAAYGMTPKQVQAMLPQLNKWRSGNRQIMSSSRRFMSQDVRKLAEKRIAQGRTDEAGNLTAMADNIDDAVKRGDMPGAHYAIPDEDGNLAFVPEDVDITTNSPVLVSQHADVTPMMDWHVLDSGLKWNTRGGFGKAVYTGVDGTRQAMDSLMSLWKISAILRPGYVWRAASDEIGRVFATLGAGRSFMANVGVVKNSAHNWSSRGRLVGEAVRNTVAARKAKGADVIDLDGELDDAANSMPAGALGTLHTGAQFDPEGPVRVGKDGPVYQSYERALADGVLSVPDFLERVASHGELGTLTPHLAEIHAGRHHAGTIDERTYRRHAIDSALGSVDRAVYSDPAWQQSLLSTVTNLRASKAAGEVGVGLVVDPFSGVSPKVSGTGIPNHFSMSNTKVIKPTDGEFNIDDVYDFVADNVDELLKPGSVLSAYQAPHGAISLSVARANAEAAANLAIKPSGGKRVKLPFVKKTEGRLYRDSGSASFRLNTPVGLVTIKGAFEGQNGDLLRQQTSSRGLGESWADQITNKEHARLMAKSGRWVDIAPDKPEYRDAWERAVNLQLANDDVARQFLAGKTLDDVMAWMHNTTPGRAYQAKMGPWKSRYAEQAQIVQSMVDLYAPMVRGRKAESIAMRKSILNGKGKFDQFKGIMPEGDMPNVHGASIEYATGTGKVMDWFRKSIDKAFKVLSDIPNDKFVRHPFAAERYQMHVDELVKVRAADLEKHGGSFAPSDLEAIEKQARSRANLDVRKYLYENASSLDLAKAFRLLVPFGSAIGDSTVKWGIVLRENPHTALNLWKIWSAPDKAGLVQDDDGNQLKIEDGREVWYQVDPKTGKRTRLDNHEANKRVIVFRLPSWLSPEYAKGMQPVVHLDKDVFRTFLDMPTFGPLITVPANEFALKNPEFADKAFVQRFILPFGPSADWQKAGVPGNVRNLWEKWKGEDSEEAASMAQSIFMTEMVSYATGKRPNAPTFEEARQKSADMRGLRFWWRWGGVSAQFVSPYQPYIDHYHMLRVQDPQSADEKFYDEMGPEFFSLTAAVTRNTMGLPATIGAFNQHKKLRELMERFPELSSLISGEEGAGSFSRAVYEAQKETETRFGSGEKMRRRMPPEEAWADVETRRGWVEYGKFADALHADMVALGVTSLQQKAASELKDAKHRWLEQRMYVDSPYGGTVLNPWYQDFSTFDTSKMSGRLHAMRQIVQDPKLQGRDDMRGLIDYLSLRGQVKNYMADMGYHTLDSKKAGDLQLQWQHIVFGLKERNLSFAQLYDRWLSNDESLEAV